MEAGYGENSGILYPYKMACESITTVFEAVSRKAHVHRRIPLMAMTAQFYFGRRAWQLWGRNRWVKWFFIVVPTITMLCGVA